MQEELLQIVTFFSIRRMSKPLLEYEMLLHESACDALRVMFEKTGELMKEITPEKLAELEEQDEK